MPPPAEGLASRLFMGPALRTQPDRRLVTLVREGYEAAFEEIVRRYGRPLGRYAASIVGGRSEDVLQDAFAKALPALRRDDAEIDLRPWLFRIVRNTALNDLRDSPPTPELLAEALASGRDPADELEQREELADLMKRLQALPEPQRAAIVMRELEGLGHEEIAAALGLTDGGARQAIYRARQALRDGAGMLLPLPLLRLLVDHGGEAVGVGAGAGAGGALAAAGASAGGVGAGGALKLGVVAVVVAGSVGAGVAVQDHESGGVAAARPVPTVSSPPTTRPASRHGADGSNSGSEEGSRRGRSGSNHGNEDVDGHRGGSGGGPGPSADRRGSHEGHGHGDERHDGGSGDDFGRHDGDHGSGGHGGRSGSSPSGDDGGGSGDSGRHGGSGSGSGGGELDSTGGSGHGGPGPGGGPGDDGGGSGSGDAGATAPSAPPPESSTSDDSGGGSSGGSGDSGGSTDSSGGSSSPGGPGSSGGGGDGLVEPAP